MGLNINLRCVASAGVLGILDAAAGCAKHEAPLARAPLARAAVVGCYRLTWRQGDSTLTGPAIPDLVRLDSTRECPSCPPSSTGATYLSLGTWPGNETEVGQELC